MQRSTLAGPPVILRTEALTKRYGSLVAVDHLSLSIYEGEVLGLLGPNGAGKTTAINLICGLLTPDEGRVVYHGGNGPTNGSDWRPRVGVCPQHNILWPKLTCLEQLQFVAQLYGLSARAARERADGLLEELNLADRRDSLAQTLSGGLQRRLNLALALVHDPEIVILDEPEAGLDPQTRVRVRAYVKGLARRKTIILTTHNMDEADRLADRVAIIDHGRLLVLDAPQALKQRLGQGDVVEITLDGAGARLEDLPARLARLKAGVQATVTNGTLTVRALDAVNLLPQIMAALAEAGVRPGEVRLRPNTLEDVFIQLTGRGLRE